MTLQSTGPVENNPVSGVRPAQQVTVRIVSRAAMNTIPVNVQGYVLGATRALYVSELIEVSPNQSILRNYYADLDAFEFVFDLGIADDSLIGISVWGKQTSGNLVTAQRIVTHEKLTADL